MFRRPLALLLLLVSAMAQAADTSSRQLAAELLAMTGTAAVFGHPDVHAALADPEPFVGVAAAPRRERLLEATGFRRWHPMRVWILQSRREGEVRHWENFSALVEADAQLRGYRVLVTKPLPSAEEAVSILQPGKPHPGLPAFLKAYGADALVLIDDQSWGLWTTHAARRGVLPATASLLPEVLAETLAALQQWPEAGERIVVQVTGVGGFADLARVQAVLQALPGARQVQIIRVDGRQAWFALAGTDRSALELALDGEARLADAVKTVGPGVPARAIEACRIACPLLSRQWLPEAAAEQSPSTTAPVQSLPL